MPIESSGADFMPVTLDAVEGMLPLMRAYYEFDRLDFDEDHARQAIRRLIEDESLGRAWLIQYDGEIAGYVALTCDYGLDNGGREGFIDELYLEPDFRGKVLAGRPSDSWKGSARRKASVRCCWACGTTTGTRRRFTRRWGLRIRGCGCGVRRFRRHIMPWSLLQDMQK